MWRCLSVIEYRKLLFSSLKSSNFGFKPSPQNIFINTKSSFLRVLKSSIVNFHKCLTVSILYFTCIIFLLTYLREIVTDDDDGDDELFLWYGWPMKGIYPYFQPGPLSEILTIANLGHAASMIWTCAEPELRLCWMNLCSSDNHYTTVPLHNK